MFVDIEVCLHPLSDMEVTRQVQYSYVKIAVLQGRNAKECHSELTEALCVVAAEQVVACALVTQRSPFGTSFLGEVFPHL